MKYYIIAGEASGDLHGAHLIDALAQADPKAELRYWGGDLMADACLRNNLNATRVRHIKDLAYMGFVEVATHLRTVLGNIDFCKKDLLDFRPDTVIYIDYPGFNLKIAKFAHRHGLRNYHYISPQLWAWKKGRIKSMRRDLDRLFYILPFEKEFYASNQFPQATYVGHPLLDAIGADRNHFASQYTEKHERPIVALLPGSRKQELRKMLPQMVAVARRHPQYDFVIAGMSLIGNTFYDKTMGDKPSNVSIVIDQTYPILANAHAAIVCSGTATLETALFDVPQVVCYRANPISIAIARMVVSRRIKYISLVNLIADRPIVTELIQGDMTDEHIDSELTKIAEKGEPRDTMLANYHDMRHLLGDGGASKRVAQTIVEETGGQR